MQFGNLIILELRPLCSLNTLEYRLLYSLSTLKYSPLSILNTFEYRLLCSLNTLKYRPQGQLLLSSDRVSNQPPARSK